LFRTLPGRLFILSLAILSVLFIARQFASGFWFKQDLTFVNVRTVLGDMRLLGVHVMGEQATEIVHIGLIAMLSDATAELFNRACFNYPTLGDLYKYAAYDAILQTRTIGMK
jgi:pyruvate/2-oxoglutarate dehydrogenase complex dihydrolipoamide dehydrogenase (E3) component